MNKIKIEFFHDTICSFCFPMSYRMRKLQEQMPEVEIIHRSFALVKEERDFDKMFINREKAKDEILLHWHQANQNDDLHRFNIEGMRSASFSFPTSMKSLWACKAAYYIGGDALYWNVFDKLQEALFVRSLDIGSLSIIESCVQELGIDIDVWLREYESERVREAVEQDLQLAISYGLHGVPALVINGEYIIKGAVLFDEIIHALQPVITNEK